MSSVRKDLRAALKAHFSTGTSALDRVFVNRKVSLKEDQEYPLLLIYSGTEQPTRIAQLKNVYQRTYTVVIEIRVSGFDEDASGPVDDVLDDVASEVEARMNLFTSSLVKSVVYAGAEPAIDDEGDTIMGSLKLSFDFMYIL